jgi:hypothetical protein
MVLDFEVCAIDHSWPGSNPGMTILPALNYLQQMLGIFQRQMLGMLVRRNIDKTAIES